MHARRHPLSDAFDRGVRAIESAVPVTPRERIALGPT